jgi:hypothetical protein
VSGISLPPLYISEAISDMYGVGFKKKSYSVCSYRVVVSE